MPRPRPEPTVPFLWPTALPRRAARRVVAAGHRTRYYQTGDGPPLVFLPSTFGRAASYRGPVEALAESFRVTLAEMPGSGGSQRVRRPWGFAECADWAAALIEALGLGPSLVVGHSDSGGVAAVLAARHPVAVRALVLADVVGTRAGGDTWAAWGRMIGGRLNDAALEFSTVTVPLLPHALANLARHPANVLHHLFRLTTSPEPLEAAPLIAAPTLIAWGLRDHTFPPDCADRLRDAVPDSRTVWSFGSHDWPITHPREFADAVAAFAADLGLLPAPAPGAEARPARVTW